MRRTTDSNADLNHKVWSINPEIFPTLHQAYKKWPGIKEFHIWTDHAMFGRIKQLNEIVEGEMMAAEEEGDDYMDATALSETEELERIQSETGIIEGTDSEAPLETAELPVQRVPTSPLPLIKVRTI